MCGGDDSLRGAGGDSRAALTAQFTLRQQLPTRVLLFLAADGLSFFTDSVRVMKCRVRFLVLRVKIEDDDDEQKERYG